MLSILSKIQKTILKLFKFQLELLLKIQPIFYAIDVVQRLTSYLVISIIYPVFLAHIAFRKSKINILSKIKVSFVLVFILIWLGGFQKTVHAETWITYYASPCTQEDEKTAKEDDWNRYDPQRAYDFGKHIQNLVRDQDLEGIFQLVEGELKVGPRKSFVKEKTFSEIFPEEWVQFFLSGKPRCSREWHRDQYEFMMNGLWYNKVYGRGWQITRIFGANEEADYPGSDIVGWKVNGRLLHSDCFTTSSWSGENMVEIEEYYEIRDYPSLRFWNTPGFFLGREITDFSPFVSTWCFLDSCSDNELSLAHSVEKCAPTDFDHSTYGTMVLTNTYSEYTPERVSGYQMYDILATVSTRDCERLTPNLDAKCESSYLLQISDNGGGTSTLVNYGIYGVFVLDPIGLAVVPLKYFDNQNDAFNFLDEMASKTNLYEL